MPGIHRLVLLLISDKQNRAWGLCGTLALMLFAPIAPLTARAQPIIVIPSKADEREVIGGIFKRWIIHPGVSAAMAADTPGCMIQRLKIPPITSRSSALLGITMIGCALAVRGAIGAKSIRASVPQRPHARFCLSLISSSTSRCMPGIAEKHRYIASREQGYYRLQIQARALIARASNRLSPMRPEIIA